MRMRGHPLARSKAFFTDLGRLLLYRYSGFQHATVASYHSIQDSPAINYLTNTYSRDFCIGVNIWFFFVVPLAPCVCVVLLGCFKKEKLPSHLGTNSRISKG